MRYFQRDSMRPPPLLGSPLADRRRRDIAEFISYSSDGNQQRRAPLDRSLLMNPEVASALSKGFRSACAYCETPIASFRGPCHHRPPGVAANDRGETDFLHYVWLAYEWDNLYLACEVCTKHKENRFPVRHRRGRIGASIVELREVEGEMLLDPCLHDPSEHLEFLPMGVVRPLSEEGKESIETLALNRPQLVQARHQSFQAVARMIQTGAIPEVAPTGISYGPGSQVLDEALPHSGAASLMLMNLGRRSNMPAEILATFLRFLRSSAPDALTEILNDLGPSSAQPAAPSLSPRPGLRDEVSRKQAGSAAARSRRFRIGEQPLATVPITRIRIKDFKALEDMEFELPVSVEDSNLVPCMLLLGENAAGKSTVLEAIALALLGTREVEALNRLLIDDEVTPRDLIRRPDPGDWSKTSPGPVEAEIGFLSRDETARISGANDAGFFTGREETAKILLAYGPRRYFTGRKTRRLRAPARRVRSLFDPMATIANPLEWLLRCPPAAFVVAARALKEILMLGDEAEFSREADNLFVVTATQRLPLTEMSVGYKSVIAMATDIMRELMYHYDNIEFAHAVVLIDEIETHLHPRWKMRIVGLLRRAFPKVQFIFTTHDPLCLRGMYDGEVFVLRRDPDTGEVAKLDDLPSIRGMRAEQLLMSEYFGLGSTDPETDAKLIRYHELVARKEHSPEVERLRSEIQATMKVGDTIQEQVVSEAMRNAAIDPFAPLAPVKSRSRRQMVEALLDNIGRLRDSQAAGLEE